MKSFAFIVVIVMFAAAPAAAEGVAYFSDPPYKLMNDEDAHPMTEMEKMAQDGDARAQFILGDLYAKGKGGVAKNTDKAEEWFGLAGVEGYAPAFIRLAAMARARDDVAAAHVWYTLAAEKAGYGDLRRYAQSARAQLVLSREQKKQAQGLLRDWKEKEKKRERAK